MIIQNKRIIASILFVLISVVCVAQASPPPPGTPGPPPGLALPIDGGGLFGLCCGLFYGVVKMLNRNKAN